jgi:hypothetical protein
MMRQGRKRALTKGLETKDAGFVKKLTRVDVAFLPEQAAYQITTTLPKRNRLERVLEAFEWIGSEQRLGIGLALALRLGCNALQR